MLADFKALNTELSKSKWRNKHMKIKKILIKSITVMCLNLGLMSLSVHAANIDLFDRALNLDGAFSGFKSDGAVIPASVNTSNFDDLTGLGTLSVMFTTPGAHNATLFVDHEIDESTNTFFNEFGTVNDLVSLAAGQSWEIDEPGFLFGDINLNIEDNTLDNLNSVPNGSDDDVSMALGFIFNLNVDEKATVTWTLSETTPTSGFFLSQSDPDSNASIFFSSSLSVQDVSGGAVPEPSTYAMFTLGLLGLGFYNRRKKKASTA